MKQYDNILLVSGSGRNVGKTTFICQAIKNSQQQDIIAIKITPHFHTVTDGLISLKIDDNFKVFEETNRTQKKDTSLFLSSGAQRVFYIQTNDQDLEKAIEIALNEVNPKRPVVIESAALRNFIVPGLFLLIRKEKEAVKTSMLNLMHLADNIIISEGKQFSISPKSVTFNQTWKIENND